MANDQVQVSASDSEEGMPSSPEKKRKLKKNKKDGKKRKKKGKEKDKKKKKHRKNRAESDVDNPKQHPVVSSTADDESAHAKPHDERTKKRKRETNETGGHSSEFADGAKIRPLVESSALDFTEPLSGRDEALEESSASATAAMATTKVPRDDHNTTLLLFYQYVEPQWTVAKYNLAKQELAGIANTAGVTGRMRVAREGLNCTLTGTAESILGFCNRLRKYDPVFCQTEFKLTHDLPDKQRFRELKVIPVLELVHYGLEGDKAPPIHLYQGTHLEPKDYHAKLAEKETVVIDVRNHYEAVIGRFDPPNSKWLDPRMRKSTSFPVWLDDPETKKELANKQVLMYCTGGIRCERASALLKYKMETDPEVAGLNIQGVYQLQGGIDKYFKEFPDGGYWKGKNYVFDKRFAHAPPAVATASATEPAEAVGADETEEDPNSGSGMGSPPPSKSTADVMGKCECCRKPWDMFRGKRRCPTCGVPSLICKECWENEDSETIKNVRCDLCVEQHIFSKRDFRAKEQQEIEEYESRLFQRGLLLPSKVGTGEAPAPHNPLGTTRLYIKNMCKKNMTEDLLMENIHGITHIVWKLDHRSQAFLGAGWVEMESPEAAARAVAKSGMIVLRRPLYIEYQPPDGKDKWPPLSSAVQR